MEGSLILWLVIISVFVRTESSYCGKFNVVGGDNIDIMRTEFSFEKGCNCTTEFGGKFNGLGGDNIGHFGNRNFIWREGEYCGW
jgi:hypothetical protein